MVQVRTAATADMRLLKQLIDEMGHHERMQVFASEERLKVDGFGPTREFRALIAEVNKQVAGYALYFPCYSSFQGRGIFLEDLFVRERFRGHGVGRSLLSRIAEIATDLGCFGIMFNVLDWNKSALRFFSKRWRHGAARTQDLMRRRQVAARNR